MLLHELLQQVARKEPERAAIRHKGNEITYGALARWSDRLAARLSEQGIGPGDRVGFYLDKSIGAVAAIFGILKSGAAYVPLDPTGPPDRQAGIIDDGLITVLLSSSNKFARLERIFESSRCARKVLCIDGAETFKTRLPEGIDIVMEPETGGTPSPAREWAPPLLQGDAPAYILYTSGSTGDPKGVMISHRAAMAFVDWAHHAFQVTQTDVLSGHAPFHFDLSIFDLFVSIKAGALLCLVPQGLSAFPASLGNFLAEERISIWYSVPSALIQLAINGSPAEKDLSSLKKILFAGEVFPSKYLRILMQSIPQAEYYNLYGPTETNVCTWHHVARPPETDRPLPIGVPCIGQELFVLDNEGNEVPAGALGELFVRGGTLMTGYFNQPRETRKRFHERRPGSREEPLYATGDLVKYNAAGVLEFHGRKDNLIKSRGYRIELGEIERVLANHSDVHAAAVFGIPDEVIGNRIGAVIMPNAALSVCKNSLRSYCAEKLPGYMIPDEIQFVADFPRTSTGKIDKKAMERVFYE